MKRLLILLVFILMVSGLASAQTDSSKPLNSNLLFLIKIYEDRKSNNQKSLTFTLRNNSQGRVIVKEVGNETERNHTVELKNSNGEIVPLSADGQRLTKFQRNEISVIYVRLAAGEEITRRLDLTRLYSLQDGEKYTISVTKSVYMEAEKKYRKIKSNTVEEIYSKR